MTGSRINHSTFVGTQRDLAGPAFFSWRLRATIADLGVASVLLVCPAARADDYQGALGRAVTARDHALESETPENWQMALDQFAAVIEVRPTKEAKFEYAQAAAKLGLVEQAYVAYGEALQLGLLGRAEQRSRSFIDEHKLEMAGLQIDGPPGTRVYAEGRLRGMLPLASPLVLSAGSRLVRLEAPQYRAWESRTEVGTS